jgi:competence protein ComEC
VRLPAPPHALLGSYCAGLLLVLAWRPPLVLLLAAAVLAAGALAGAVRAPALAAHASAVVLGGLVVLFACAGAVLGGARLDALAQSALRARVGERVALTAVLTDLPAVKEDQVTLAVRVTDADGRAVREPAHLRLRLEEGQTLPHDPTGPLTEGALLRMSCVSVEPLPAPEPGEFDYGRYLRRRGEHVLLEAEFADLQVVGRRGGLQGAVDRLRLASRAHLAAGVHAPVADVLQGMVLGDDEGVDPAIEEEFRRSGLLHIMAVSGENVVLLCSMWSFAFALLGMHRLLRTALLVPVVATYVLLTGASPSIVRAGVAGICGLLAVLASRPSDGWLLWLAPAAWLLTLNPNNLFDVSFQLSFGAVVGLLVLARPLTRAVSFLPGPLPEQVGVTAAASISTAPISVLTFGSASLVSVPANVAGGFVLGPIMFLGMLSLLAGFVSAWLSAPLNVVAGLFIGFLLSVSHFFAGLPGAVYEYQGVTLRLLLVAALLAATAVVTALAARSGEGLLAYVRDRRRWPPFVAATAALVAAALLLAPAPVRPPDTPTLTFLDVGEGAASLLQVPGGPTVLVDAGPRPLGPALRRHAVSRVDLLVVSHGHADHIAGLEDVVGRVDIGTALLPQPPQPSDALDELAARLEAAGTVVRRVTAQVEVAGEGWAFRVLPTGAPGEGGNQGENDCALVALVELDGHRALVPGDAEGEVLADLRLPQCDVVELPHHGSRGGVSTALLAELGPRLGVISVGPNTYGHPTPESLDLLAAAGVPCARTDQQGDISVWAVPTGLAASASGAAAS